MQTLRFMIPLSLVCLLGLGCRQQEGDVCESYSGGQGDCDEGLQCCGARDGVRGRCMPTGTCPMPDAGTDAGPDAGPDASVVDAGPDAGEVDAGEVDAGEVDAGPDEDAGPGDAGPGDAGPGDAGPGDAGPGDAGPGDAGTDGG